MYLIDYLEVKLLELETLRRPIGHRATNLLMHSMERYVVHCRDKGVLENFQ